MNEEEPPVRWSPQMAIMIMVVISALFAPLLAVSWFARDYFEARRAAERARSEAVAEAEAAALRDSLERAAEKVLDEDAASRLDDDVVMVMVPPDAVRERIEHILSEAQKAGAFALEMPGDSGDAARLVVTVASARAGLFREAAKGLSIDFSGVPTGEETTLLDLRLRVAGDE